MNTQPLKIFIKRIATPWRWWWQDMRTPMSATVNVVGDSHGRYFRYLQEHHPLEQTRLRVFRVTGATAAGMTNPTSKTRALPAMRHVLRRLPRQQAILITLGEVDVGFVIPMRCQRDGSSPQDPLQKVFEAYMQFVSEVVAMGFSKVILATVTPPTIEDWSQWPGPIGHLRKQVTMSLKDRTQLSQQFNALLRTGASKHGYVFLDVESAFVDEQGTLRPEMVSDRPGDLHLNNDQTSAIYRTALQQEGFV